MAKDGSRDALAATLRNFADQLSKGIDDEDDEDEDDEDEDDDSRGKCFFCNLAENMFSSLDDDDELDEDLVHKQLANACAYGVEILSRPDASLLMCDACDKDLKRACRRARADLKATEQPATAAAAAARTRRRSR